MGIFLAFLIGIGAGVMVPKMRASVEKKADDKIETVAGNYLPISKVKCPTCLMGDQKSHSMVINELDDLQTTRTEYRCTRGHEWTVIVEKTEDLNEKAR